MATKFCLLKYLYISNNENFIDTNNSRLKGWCKILLKPQFENLEYYLETSEVIDFGYQISREVTDVSFEITTYSTDEIDYIKNAYQFVRDNIFHSADIHGQVVTCKASEVLLLKEGTCFAKSHLLAAILRCNLIPTGFCYQRLIQDDEINPYYILHGLNAVYIEKLSKWIRLDARGNKHGINAQFSLEQEELAFPVRVEKGEEDIPVIFARPDKNVIEALTNNENLEMLLSNLPARLSVTNN